MKNKYLVHCWGDGSAYDAGKPALKVFTVTASNEAQKKLTGIFASK